MGLNDEINNVVKWDVPSVSSDDSLRTVIQKMVDNKVTAVLIKSGDDVLGVATDMDILNSIDNAADLDETKSAQMMTACEMITNEEVQSPCVQLDPTISVEMALGVMARAGVHHLMVSGDGKSVGMVSIQDLLSLVVS